MFCEFPGALSYLAVCTTAKGHWLNLLHTFSGGCDPGDLVDDTNAQSEPVGRAGGSCPSPFPDTCRSQKGRDPLDNMMDYSPVACADRFTQGQIARMHEAWTGYRAPDES
jgi:hypothetical protein